MADIKRTQFIAELAADSITDNCALFLFYGERYLCQESADTLQKTILAGSAGTVHRIDGSLEDAGQTLARLQSFSLLPGVQIYRVNESRIFQSKTVIEKIWKKAQRAQRNNRSDAATRQLLDMAQLGGISKRAMQGTQVFSEISKSAWKSSFGFDKPSEDMAWADLLISQSNLEQSGAPADLIDNYINAFDRGIPPNNILILTAETVDKRQRFFSYCKKNAITVDCSVSSGGSSAAKKDQIAVVQEQLNKTLGSFGKKITPAASKIFIERVGCHPVAVVHEAEKLACYIGEKIAIETEDVQALTCQTREDALYELTEALSNRQAARALTILNRILANNTHALVIIATLRNFYRKLLLMRTVQHKVPWSAMSSQQFQNTYLPKLKQEASATELCKGHPFALYNQFKRASEYSSASLKKRLCAILETEMKLKSSFLPPQLLVEELLLSLLRAKKL